MILWRAVIYIISLLGSASGSLISLICDRFTMLLRDYPKSQTVLRESGFSVVISRMISTLTEAAQRDRLEEDSFEGRALQSFDSIAGCLTEMLKDSSNAQIFKKTYVTSSTISVLFRTLNISTIVTVATCSIFCDSRLPEQVY